MIEELAKELGTSLDDVRLGLAVMFAFVFFPFLGWWWEYWDNKPRGGGSQDH